MSTAGKGSEGDKLRVLVREIHYGDGVTARQLNVYCRRRETCVPAHQCTTCSFCEGFTLDDSGRHSFLICNYGQTAADVSAISETGGADDALSIAERTPIERVMTKDVVCVTEDMAVEDVSRLLLERGFGGVPVVDNQGTAIGVVSKTDLVREAHERVAVEEIDLETGNGGGREAADELARYQLGPGFHTEQPPRATVRDIMTPITYSLKANTSVAQAAALMAFEGVHRLPIVTAKGGEIVGLLSSLDILRWLGEQNGYLLRHLSEDTGLVA